VAIVEPPSAVTERLAVADGEAVVVRRRVCYVDGTPYQLTDSYFRLSLVQGTPLTEPRDASAPGGILAKIGHPQVRYADEITVRMPTKQETDRLDLPAGTPVAEVVRTGYDSDDVPLRVMVTVAPGDRNRLIYDLDAS
jgi:DNA-binding GntR family transcriptional regulator